MRTIIWAIFLLAAISSPVFATWAMISLDDLVADSDLIVLGTLHSATEDSRGLGKGYILVDSLVTKGTSTLAGGPLASGDNLKITWADDWACASGMHRSWENRNGIWLLKIQKDGTVIANYPGRFRPTDDLEKIANLVHQHGRKSGVVDVSTQNEAQDVQMSARTNEPNIVNAVDITPFNDYSVFRASIAFLLSIALYSFLYRGRFRIR